MQENLTIARPYAQAAFEQAQADGSVAAWADALELLAQLAKSPDMQRVIGDPRIGQARIVELVLDLGGASFFALFRNFVKVLASARRLAVAPEIAERFAAKRADFENVANVEVHTAFPLDDAQRSRIAAAMKQRLGKEIRITEKVDPALIGGARVRVGDMVFDASLRGRLDQLAGQFNVN